MSDWSVYVVNPKKSKKKAAKKKTSRRKKSTKKMAGKKKAARRKPTKRRSTPRAPARRAPARRRRRRRRNPAPARRSTNKRRRKNPMFLAGGVGSVFAEMRKSIPRLIGALATAWAVKQWGKPGGLFGQDHTSEMLGKSWGWSQYAIAGAVAAWGPKVFGRFIDATEFRRGAVDLIMFKAVWTEGIARSPWAVRQFGNPGDVAYDPSGGGMYVDQGGSWNSMQGLVEESPLDGLVEASPMDGAYGGSMGHLLPANVSPSLAAQGRYSGSGYTSNYHAAFTR